MHIAEYDSLDALAMAELVHKKELKPIELVECAIERAEQRNPAINAIIHTLYDRARERAKHHLPDGPFKGVPMLLKDLGLMLDGAPTCNGSRGMRGFVAKSDSELVARFRHAGVVFIGKTNTPEFGLTPYTEPEAFGPALNPWDTTRTPGGSSGGSGAAVAARIVPIASGGDGGGSIRIPASCCGVFGLKPTRARTPSGPYEGEAWEGFTVSHVITRSVRDSAAMLDATEGPDLGTPYFAPPKARPFLDEVTTEPRKLRIAFTTKVLIGPHLTPHQDCVTGLHNTVKLLEDLGHEVVEAAPHVHTEQLALDFVTMLFGQVRNDIEEAAAAMGRKPKADQVELATWALGLLGNNVDAGDYVAAVRRMQRAARHMGHFFQQHDVLLTPTLSRPPVKIGELKPSAAETTMLNAVVRMNAGWILKALNLVKQLANKTFAFIPYTPLFNVTGQPGMSVPLHWNEAGLPIGMQFVGRFGDEATLFQLAGQLERARPWANKMPPLVSAK